MVWKLKSQQHHLIVAAIVMTKLILAWFASTRESGKFGGELYTKYNWEAVIKLTNVFFFTVILETYPQKWVNVQINLSTLSFFRLKWVLNRRKLCIKLSWFLWCDLYCWCPSQQTLKTAPVTEAHSGFFKEIFLSKRKVTDDIYYQLN